MKENIKDKTVGYKEQAIEVFSAIKKKNKVMRIKRGREELLKYTLENIIQANKPKRYKQREFSR